jgi:intracellular septation protein A
MGIPIHLFLLQLLPIIVFLVVDMFVDDAAWAIGSALCFVGVQTLITWIRKHRLDPMVLVDALLIGAMGAASLISDDELFFKIKPAVIEGLMVPYLLFLALASEKALTAYFDRYAAGVRIHPAALPMMRKLLMAFAAGVVVHAGVTVWAALALSRQAWGWVSGPGFYVILIPFGIWVLVQRIRNSRRRSTPSVQTNSK